jgi:hypothetical protein
MDKFGRKLLCFFSGVLATFGTLVLILSVNTALLYVGAILIGIATGFFYAASWALGTLVGLGHCSADQCKLLKNPLPTQGEGRVRVPQSFFLCQINKAKAS